MATILTITADNSRTADRVTKILRQWMEGDSMMAVTWQSISIALRQCHSLSASSLAHQIKLMTLKNM